MTQFLIKVPVEQKLKTNKKAFRDSTGITEEFMQITDDILWNTREFGNKKLINIHEDISLEAMQERIDTYKLKWGILSAVDGYHEVDGEQVLNSLLDYKYNDVIKFIARRTGKTPTVVALGKLQGLEAFKQEVKNE